MLRPILIAAFLVLSMSPLLRANDILVFDDQPPAVTTQQVDQSQAPSDDSDEGGSSAADLAKKLSNPVASLISVPFQNNFDFDAGQTHNKFKYTLNIQPVIPTSLSENWNLITRIIVPVIYQEQLAPGQGDNFGLGDTTPTFFFSPKRPVGGWIIGAGPVFLLPTATDTALGSGKFGLGPSIVVLQQNGPWTYGILFNHIWSVCGDDSKPEVDRTFLQPFLAYNTATGFGISLQSESTYDWQQSQWTIPIGVFASQVLKVGGQPISLSAGPRVYAEGPSGTPKWGFRFTMTFLFPQK
jgi:hypothetical protein